MLNAWYQTLSPIAFTVGPFAVRWYGLAYLTAFVLGAVLAWHLIKRWRLSLTVDDLMTATIGIAFGVILGGRLGYVLFYGAGYYLQNPGEILNFSHGGMSFHGGLVGAVVGGCIACRIQKINIPTMCDLAAIVTPIGLCLGRIANFINGELWGAPTDLPWGVVFSAGDVARHPTQLYEAFLEGVVIFVVLMLLARRTPPRPQGTFMGWFLVLYAVFRMAIELVRVPDEQLGYLFGPVTMGMLLSLPVLAVGVVLLVWAHRTQRPQAGYVDRV